MNQKEYETIEEKFNSYYESYKKLSSDIDMKYRHSYQVAKYMEELAKRLGMKEKDVYLAKAIGLLHDIGRFEQLKNFHSFSDKKFDHADYAVVYLFDEGHIRDFIKKRSLDHIIREAIRNHNKYLIQEGLTKKELLFAKMIRDMDRVDIYYQIVPTYNVPFKEDPSKKVVKDFYDGKTILSADVKNKSDQVIQFLGFVNDFSFKESLEILEESKNFEKYMNNIETNKEHEKLLQELKDYISKKTKVGENYGK